MISIQTNYDLHYFNNFKLKDVLSIARASSSDHLKFITRRRFYVETEIKISCIE